MYISHEAKLIYLAPPGAASRTCRDYLLKSYPDMKIVGKHHAVRAEPLWRETYTWIMSVRNPYPRLQAWLNVVRRVSTRLGSRYGIHREIWTNLTLSELFNYGPFQKLVCREPPRFASYLRHAPPDINFIRMEQLADDLHKYCGDNKERREIPHLGNSALDAHCSTPWWKEYTPAAVNAVKRFFAADFEALSHIYTDSFEDAKEGVLCQRG